jgi:hypothetical protein
VTAEARAPAEGGADRGTPDPRRATRRGGSRGRLRVRGGRRTASPWVHERDLAEVVEKVGRATGQRFLFDDSLQGLVTLTSPELVSPAEALELLHTVLLMKGFAALPT